LLGFAGGNMVGKGQINLAMSVKAFCSNSVNSFLGARKDLTSASN
jgi:hypothetical protein